MNETNLHFVILTHNFDFYRTVATRTKENVRPAMVQRVANGLQIENPKYVFKNPFDSIRKGINNGNDNDLITSIPFVRNLIEYSTGTDSLNYLKLTSLLHLKPTTKTISFKELESVYKEELRDNNFSFSRGREDQKIYYLILNLAKGITFNNNDIIDLDGKVIISIAIRLLAEEFIIDSLLAEGCDQSQIDNISNVQTGKLVDLFKQYCPTKTKELIILNRVLLMSSENIHINSFMFEPLVDISIKSLVDLFGQICILQPPKYAE